MKKKYDHAAEAAKKFITMPEENKEAEAPKKSGRTTKQQKSAYILAKEEAEAKAKDSILIEVEEGTGFIDLSKSVPKTKATAAHTPLKPQEAPEATKTKRTRKSIQKPAEDNTESKNALKVTVTKAQEEPKTQTFTVTYSKGNEPEPPLKKSERKAAFSVWMDKQTAEDVKLYSAISGEKMTDIIESAVREYMKNHELTYEQRSEYRKREEERMKRI